MVKKMKYMKYTIYFCEGCGIHTYSSVELGIPELSVSALKEDVKGIKLSFDHERNCINKILGYNLIVGIEHETLALSELEEVKI